MAHDGFMWFCTPPGGGGVPGPLVSARAVCMVTRSLIYPLDLANGPSVRILSRSYRYPDPHSLLVGVPKGPGRVPLAPRGNLNSAACSDLDPGAYVGVRAGRDDFAIRMLKDHHRNGSSMIRRCDQGVRLIPDAQLPVSASGDAEQRGPERPCVESPNALCKGFVTSQPGE